MSDSFKDKFIEIGGLWATKSGKGFSGKLKQDVDAEQQVFVFENHSDNPKAPKYKMFVERPKQALPSVADMDDEAPF